MAEATADQHYMRLALQLAERGRGHVEPNPMVGCVIVLDGRVIGRGFHRAFGGPHAEVEALADCSPANPRGATAYVTLEPCCHFGKTPPCSRALIEAGIARVVVAMSDPFPQVDGGSLKQLANAGIVTSVGILENEASHLNAPYLKLLRHHTPWVIAKWAMTADGKIATVERESQWITGDRARNEVHRLRGQVDAIAVGVGTVAADNPLLTARPPGARRPTRLVFCQHRLPADSSQLISSANQPEQGPVLVVAAGKARELVPRKEWAARHVEVLDVESTEPAAIVSETLRRLGDRRFTNLLVEGGAELLASFFAAKQVDECHVYLGGKVFGGEAAPGPVGGAGIGRIADSIPLRTDRIDQFDNDVRVVYRRIS